MTDDNNNNSPASIVTDVMKAASELADIRTDLATFTKAKDGGPLSHDCGFRSMSVHRSGGCRSRIPADVGQAFRAMSVQLG